MIPVQTAYPKFEANQVLTNEHLNTLFAYLDEQGRLTRTNLIGIGIVCGLEPTVASGGANIVISKGCGVTSEGHMVVWDDPGPLEFFKPYTVPDDVAYATFMDDSVTPAVQYPLWELTLDRNNDPTALPLSQNFLRGIAQPAGREDEKVLLLFLECKAESNKNCSPNSCDDKGATITTTVRPLLIRKRDMDAIQAKVRALGPSAVEYLDMAASTALRFNLPELRLRRFDVESTRLTTTDDVFNAYQNILNQPFLNQVADAFSAAYTAFRPVLLRNFPLNPFTTLKTDWAFLHNGGIVTQGRHLWYQYFYDHLDTVLQAYLEFRELGLEVIGLCCPDSRLFPRHLMLANVGVAPPEMAVYRHHFMPSPLFSRLHGAMADLSTLFGRLVELLRSLELPPQVTGSGPNQKPELRITPSVLGRFPLSDKAIPYHYRPDPLFRLWDYRKNRQNKARLNLGYRALSWNTVDDFVINPLRYDIEPNNFLRVEGHIGQPYTEVMRDLLALKSEYRLPIEIVALKTGRNSDAISLIEDLDSCQFRDLEALYDALREELLCTLCEGMMYFYETSIVDTPTTTPRVVPNMPLLRDCAPNYRYATGTIGSWFETYLTELRAAPYIEIDQNNVNANSVLPVYCVLFANKQNIPNDTYPHAVAVYYLMKLADILPDKLNRLAFADFENKYQDLMGLVRFFRSEEARNIPTALREYAPEEELIDYFDHLLFACKLDPIQAIHAEFERRKRRLRDQLLLTNFIRQHPGIQHKAGVPSGGTFIVVYHGEDQSPDTTIRQGRFLLRGRVIDRVEPVIGATVSIVGGSAGSLTDLNGNFNLFATFLPATIRVRVAGRPDVDRLVLNENTFLEIDLSRPVVPGGTRFSNLFAGEVIADFYLPYLCCSDCEPVQFILPKTPPTFSWQRAGCTQPEGRGPVTITPRGGTAPYQYTTNNGADWTDFNPENPVGLVNNTALQIRDAEGVVSIVQTVTVEPPLLITLGSARTCNATGTRFTVPVTITGGRAPYKINGVTITGTAGTAEFASGQGGNVVVEDSNTPPCTASATVAAHTCPQPCILPCQGITLECGHLFWLPTTANSDLAYEQVNVEVRAFTVSGERRNGGEVVNKVFTADELKELGGILSQVPPRFNMGQFHALWAARVTAANAFIQGVLQAAFGPEAGVVMQWNYDSRTLNGFSVLNIERYQCHQFNIDLRVRYTQQQAQFERQMQYSTNTATPPAAGTNVVIGWTQGTQQRGEGKGAVPAFNCTRRDRCTPGAPPTVLCRQPRPISIPKNGDIITNITVSPATPRDVVYWEFNLAQPTISQEITPRDVRFTGNGNEVKVLVVQVNGCAAADRGILLRID
jgi:hypothetical protein